MDNPHRELVRLRRREFSEPRAHQVVDAGFDVHQPQNAEGARGEDGGGGGGEVGVD